MDPKTKNAIALVRTRISELDQALFELLEPPGSLENPVEVPVGEPVSAPEPVNAAAEEPVDAPDTRNYLVVGKAEAKPGGVAQVEILAQTLVPVNGFGMRIGCDPRLRLVNGGATQELRDLLELEPQEDVEVIAQQSRKQGTEAYLSVMVAFFNQISGKKEPDLTWLKEKKIREVTPLVRLVFQVPPSAQPGTRYELENVSWKYGPRMRNAQGRSYTLRTRNEFGTSRDVSRDGIEPTLIGGWVDVV